MQIEWAMEMKQVEMVLNLGVGGTYNLRARTTTKHSLISSEKIALQTPTSLQLSTHLHQQGFSFSVIRFGIYATKEILLK